MKLTSLRMISKDIKATVAFYEQILGITATWYTEDFCRTFYRFCYDRCRKYTNNENVLEDLTDFAGTKSTIIEFLVKNVDEEYERIKSIASEIIQEPQQQCLGNRSLLFCDPDGNMINFFYSSE